MAAMPSSSRARVEAVEEDAADQAFVDAQPERSLSFAAPKSLIRSSQPSEVDREIRRAPIAVGPGRAAIVVSAVQGGGLLGAMSEFPVQLSKVQAPPLREETLARDRLLDWLSAKIHDRVVLVTAEAGYGKTTLLADFSRRTRLRSFWYRLDRGDRDWVGFIAHLVAAVRVHVPTFGASTDALLRETATTAPPLDTVLETFLRELGSLPSDPSVLILDDFHLVDDIAEIRHIVKELLARAPERLTFVFASRRLPPVPLARLRALGEVAELLTDDLRFDAAETERLFRETYEMPLESGLIGELSRRTEGWAASLQLVRAALHDRDAVQVRAFIGSLSGAEGHLYDYLAEEVIGDLPAPLQDFLMRTSILETIDLDLGPIAAGVTVDDAKALIEDAERLGLVTRRGRQGGPVRAHPLVREFLAARLRRTIDRSDITQAHWRVARAAEKIDWRISAYHFRAAGDDERARSVVSASIDEILATGAYATAQVLRGPHHIDESADLAGLILASRMAMLAADHRSGLDLAERAFSRDPTSRAAALGVMAARTLVGDISGAISAAADLEGSGGEHFGRLARVVRLILEASNEGSVDVAISETTSLLRALDSRGDDHFKGVANLDLAYLRIAVADPAGAIEASEAAIKQLSVSAGVELTSARLSRATALAYMGDLRAARSEFHLIYSLVAGGQRPEVTLGEADVEVSLGDADRAARVLDGADDVAPLTDVGQQLRLIRALSRLRLGDTPAAFEAFGSVRPNVLHTTIAFEARRRIVEGQLLLAEGRSTAARGVFREARRLAQKQGARLWDRAAALLEAICGTREDLDTELVRAAPTGPFIVSVVADELLGRVADLSPESLNIVMQEASKRPERWLSSLRRLVEQPTDARARGAAAQILDVVGEREDVRRLRSLSRDLRLGSAGPGKALARKLAPQVSVEDLGRVHVIVGSRVVEGSEVRRKVLALLCLLVSREGFSATRDEVLEALWPDLDPASALNSLNQTVYFLRRVFEPEYREDESPGYLRQDGETMWLDLELVDSRSRRCRELVRETSRYQDSARVLALVDLYSGRFALDFAYEEWAAAYRDNLHAAFLRVVEQAIRLDANAGHVHRAIAIAERVAAVEPDAEEIQLALIRLYRLSGAFAAASERYGHYASNLKALGVEVPPLDAILADKGPIGTHAY
jgi:DNA-binding SARP family transcriptional activator